MPTQFPPSPPASPRASTSPEVISLTETCRPTPEAHRLHQPASYTPGPWNLCQSPYKTSRMALPLLRQPNEQGYSAYRCDPNLILHPVYHDQQRPTASLSRTLVGSYESRNFLHAGSMPFDLHTGASREKRLEANWSPLEPAIKQDNSEDLPYLKETFTALQSPSYGPAAPRHRELEFAPQIRLPDLSLTCASSGPMETSSLISDNELRYSPNLLYDIILRQQPVAARACGFGDRDRRVIDPPPILQVTVRDPGATPVELDSKMRYQFTLIHCELWNAEMDRDEMFVAEIGDSRQQRKLIGTLVASPFFGRDEFNVDGCFFPFPDLSCRTTGRYRLKFVLLVLDSACMKTGNKLPFRATVLSDVFEVYTAKTFPGMTPSTELTKCLKDQGCLISVKKGHQRVGKTREAGPSKD